MVQHVPLEESDVVVLLPVHVLEVHLVFELVVHTHVALVAAESDVSTSTCYWFVVGMCDCGHEVHNVANLLDRKLILVLPKYEIKK